MNQNSLYCFIDARATAERSLFQKSALLKSTKKNFSKIQFCFLLAKDSDKKYLNADDQFLLFEDNKKFSDILSYVRQSSKNHTHLFFGENEVFPDSQLFSPVRDGFCIPSQFLVMNQDKKIYQLNNLLDKNQAFWNSSVFHCFFTSRKNFFSKMAIATDRCVADSLRQSWINYFLQIGLSCKSISAATGFSFSHSISFQEIYHGNLKSFFVHQDIELKKNTQFRYAIDVLEEKEQGSVEIKAKPSEKLHRQMDMAADLDIRWLHLPQAKENVFIVSPRPNMEVALYHQMASRLQGVEYVIVLHQLRRGGAEREAVMHIRAYSELNPNKKIGLILTSPMDPDLYWHDLPNVEIIELGKVCITVFSFHEICYLLFRLLDKVEAKIVHFKGSEFAWAVLNNFGQALSLKSKIYASLYCIDYDNQGYAMSFAFYDLNRGAPYLGALLADNQHVLNQVLPLHPLKKALKINYPVNLRNVSWDRSPTKKLKLLWCSRLTWQKDINTLINTAVLFPEIEFHVFGELGGNSNVLKRLLRSNVVLHGIYDGIEFLDLNQYDAFFYTSFWDGLPNVILEVGSYAMPVISPALPGIKEILNPENSFLYNNQSELIKILDNWNFTKAKQKAKQLQMDVKSKHSWKNFMQICRVLYV